MTKGELVGFVGVGLMGGGMAKSLLRAGHSLNVFDLDQGKIDEFKALGVSAMGSLREVGEKSDVVFSSLPNPSIVKDVYLRQNGVLEGLSSGKISIDMSTVDPETSQTINKLAGEKGVMHLDSPVSGGPNEAADGKLVLLVGGQKKAFDRCKELLDILGSTVHYIGPSGSGNIVKLVNNVMSMGNIAVAAEAWVLGIKAGIDGKTLFNILRTSGGRSHHFGKRFPNVLKRNFEAGFTIDLARKDVDLALQVAKNVGVVMPTASLTTQLYNCNAAIKIRTKS